MSVFKVIIIIQCLCFGPCRTYYEEYLSILWFFNSSHSKFKIVGGKEIPIEDVPYQLILMRDGTHTCGAALISYNYALSAAHCFKISTASHSVRAGTNQRSKGGIVVGVKTAILHPERVRHQYEYDIAILELENSLPSTRRIQPVHLPENNSLLVAGTMGLISGFGDTYDQQYEGSEVLRATEVFVESHDVCQTSYNNYEVKISLSVFCAWVSDGTKDACQGDSGGPFVINNVLYGVVSFGVKCGDKLYPGVYTSIPAFRDFIRINSGI